MYALVGNGDLLFRRCNTFRDVRVRVRVSRGPSCHLSLNAYVHPLSEDSIGQLIEQYPGSDKRTARSNSAQWCHLVLVQGDELHTQYSKRSPLLLLLRKFG